MLESPCNRLVALLAHIDQVEAEANRLNAQQDDETALVVIAMRSEMQQLRREVEVALQAQ